MPTRGEHYIRAEELADEAVAWPLGSTERYDLTGLGNLHALLAIAGPDALAGARGIRTGSISAPSWTCPQCRAVLHDSEAAGGHQRRHQ